jgi:TetR/AcrR family transcriptional regulator, regulator of cefoperazone and chloramphenicol sensitivity
LLARPRTKGLSPGNPAGVLASPEAVDSTRTRLLKAAAEVFAEHGYENATIRQICTRADANVALVNYHFGDKLELYTEVLRFALQPGAAAAGVSLPRAGAEPAAALRQIVGTMVERAFETGDQANLRFRLMLNEFVRPSGATARVVDVVLRPVYDRLREIVGAILKLPPDHEKTRLCVHSILGQVAHFAHSRQMLGLLWPEMKMTPAQRELVAEHITQFTLAYLNGMRSGRPRSAGTRRRGPKRRPATA